MKFVPIDVVKAFLLLEIRITKSHRRNIHKFLEVFQRRYVKENDLKEAVKNDTLEAVGCLSVFSYHNLLNMLCQCHCVCVICHSVCVCVGYMVHTHVAGITVLQ